MAADMMENEMSDLHRELDENEGVKTCKAHVHVVAAEKKSLRICEQILKNQRWAIGILIVLFVQGLLKGSSLSAVATDVLKIMLATATGGTP